jgi:putative ABC transport system permease protein
MRTRMRLYARLFFTEALRGLARHKGRTALTALGSMIGVGTMIWVVAVGEAGKARAEDELHNLGDNLVWIEAGSRNVNGVRTGTHGTSTLTPEDAQAVRREIPLLKSVAENVDGSVQIAAGNRNWNTRYRGVSPEYLDIKRWKMAEGAFLSDEHVQQMANAVVLGETVRNRIFGPIDPLGQLIRVNNMVFQVIGVLAPKGQTGSGQDQDDTIMMPWTTAQTKIRGRNFEYLDDILGSAVSMEAVNAAIDAATALLRQRHHIRSGEDDDFNIRRPDEVIKASIQASSTLQILLVALAAISLLIGGIGIMNVMLASVMQRTNEVGLRMAVGATPRAVRVQFLGEAVILSLAGGVLGVPLSMTTSFFITQLLGWPVSLSWKAAALAVACAGVVGVIAGTYPAWKASRLDPITALRIE